MTIEKARYWAENMTELSKNDRLWLNNPVIMQGVGLAPMVVAATSGYTALVLAVAVAVMLTPTRVAGAVLRKALGEQYDRFAVLCYALPAALCYIAAYFLVRHLWGPSALQQVGVYLPLLVFEPLIIRRYRAAVPEGPARALRRFTRAENTRGGWVVACYTALTFCYSGEAALLPALCTDRFGLPHAGINYGFLALGMSAGSLGFPLLARLWGLAGGRHWLAAGAAALGALCLTALPEAPPQPGRPAAKKAEGPGRR